MSVEQSQVQSYSRRITAMAEATPHEIGVSVVAPGGATTDLTYAELDRRSNQVARALADRGVGIGDLLGVELRNSPELILTVLAAWKLGASPVPIRWDLPEWEHARLMEVFAGAVIIGPDPSELFDDAGRRSDSELPDVTSPRAWGICSSGSTGTPKVIIVDRLGEHDPALVAPLPSSYGPVEEPQIALIPAPMYHTNGFAGFLQLIGGDRIIVLERFDAETILDLVERERVTTFTATTTMLQRIARLADGRDLSSLRWVLQGAATIPHELVDRWIELLGPERFFQAYGMTEGLGLALIRGDEWLEHRGSVGRGIREAEIRILDDDGNDVPTGQTGLIYLRSPGAGMYRYIGDAAPLPVTDDGFTTAGDVGWLDDDGYLYIADRRVDMIITGGANVFPAEVEAALSTHPKVADVVVIGLADPEWGRRVHAIVEAIDEADPPDEADIIAHAKDRLARYKVPKSVELIDAIPRSAATKVNRAALIEARGG